MSMCRTVCHLSGWTRPLQFDIPAADAEVRLFILQYVSIMSTVLILFQKVRVACEHNRLSAKLEELVGEVCGLETEQRYR